MGKRNNSTTKVVSSRNRNKQKNQKVHHSNKQNRPKNNNQNVNKVNPAKTIKNDFEKKKMPNALNERENLRNNGSDNRNITIKNKGAFEDKKREAKQENRPDTNKNASREMPIVAPERKEEAKILKEVVESHIDNEKNKDYFGKFSFEDLYYEDEIDKAYDDVIATDDVVHNYNVGITSIMQEHKRSSDNDSEELESLEVLDDFTKVDDSVISEIKNDDDSSEDDHKELNIDNFVITRNDNENVSSIEDEKIDEDDSQDNDEKSHTKNRIAIVEPSNVIMADSKDEEDKLLPRVVNDDMAADIVIPDEQDEFEDTITFFTKGRDNSDDEDDAMTAMNLVDELERKDAAKESEYDFLDRKNNGRDNTGGVIADTDIVESTSNVDIGAKKHISFETRVIILSAAIVVAFCVAVVLFYQAFTNMGLTSVSYDEKSEVDYRVCLKETDDYYNDACLDKGMEYISASVSNIKTTFTYDMKFSKENVGVINYYVASKLEITNSEGSLLNTMEEVLTERSAYKIVGSKAELDLDVAIPYEKYYDYVANYNSEYNVDGIGEVSTILYIDTGETVKEVASITTALSTKTFGVVENKIFNEKQRLDIKDDNDGINSSYAFVGLVFILFGLFCIIRLANLVYRMFGITNMYQRTLSKILREYDHMIVIARDGYVLEEGKRLVPVASFNELLDAHNTVGKPIVYVRVNSVKSEFYVEDHEIVYKYTMKEADFDQKK